MKGMQKITHQTVSFAFPFNSLEAPAALGAGGIPVYCDMKVELDTVVPSVEPATFALEGSGVCLVMGDAEPRDAEGLYEKGGEVGKSVVASGEFAEVGAAVERLDPGSGDCEAVPEADDDNPGILDEVATGGADDAAGEGDEIIVTEVVISVVGAVEMTPADDVGRGPGIVMLIITTVVTVVVLVEMDLWTISDP